MSITPLDIRKTYKLHIGGAFVRSESGRVLRATSPSGTPLDNYSWASRKDLRDAVVAARNAFDRWAGRTAFLRGQILYRAAEMLQQRATELSAEIQRSTGASPAKAAAEVIASVNRLVYYAGWTDKFGAVFGTVNPVATSHFNFTTPEPTGVVAVVAPDQPSLLALVSLLAPVLLSGNTAVVLASEKFPLPALTLAEVIATSDFPAGTINLLAGRRQELAAHLATHLDINAVVDAANDPQLSATLHAGQASNLKRYTRRSLSEADWATGKAEDPYWILDTVELKTAWHPVGV